ncbi:MAG: hypothetical protein WC254_06725 [Candidatus Woesearchaeota archaeon]|jgi:hypothetical protein
MKVIVNPSHGNEPYILGGLIARKYQELIGEKIEIIMPLLYPGRQERILNEEGITATLDSVLGELVQPLLFKDNDFDKHIDEIVHKRERVESAIRHYVNERYGTIDFEINTGAKTRITNEIYYAFPTVLSQLLQYTVQEGGLGFNVSNLEQGSKVMRTVEGDFAAAFIPSVHTFSYDPHRKSVEREIPTPPLKPLSKQCDKDIPLRSVYCMPSGTGSEIQTILDRAAALSQQGYSIIVPPWIKDNRYRIEEPSVIAHSNVVRVVGRAGWGTLWTCQQAETEFEPVPYKSGDDPEIYFNNKTLEARSLLEATAVQRRQFSTMDGIEYVAKQILQSRA